ncbi:hypothetical protein [Ulvibacterium sp.]|uniref:hypothetical protein n=1 Tax=Ulvibacterium sp. TaxID=2665914 RepID=UPI00345C8387
MEEQQSKIVFQSDRDGNSEIYIMNTDGTEQTRLTNNPAYDEAAAWSPKGDKIVFQSDRDGNPEIYIMNIDGSDVKRITNNPGRDLAPRWTPDGRIVFASERNDLGGIYVMDGNGTNIELFSSKKESFGGSPSSSPNGKSVVVERETGPKWTEATEYLRRGQLFIIHANGDASVQLTNIDAYNGYPSWSPDGKKVIFDSNTKPGQPPANITVISIDGSGLKNLSNSEGYNEFGAWSPDGKKITFVSDRDGNNEIYIMNADGTQQIRLTNNSFDDTIPSWSPE